MTEPMGTRGYQTEYTQNAAVTFEPVNPMIELAILSTPIAAIGYSLIYLLFGGGIFGAFVIFFIAKIFGK